MVEEIECPVCKNSDQVQKVSSIYSEGISTGATTSQMPNILDKNWNPWIRTKNVPVQSTISKRLSPPQEPNKAAIRKKFTPPAMVYIAVGILLLICYLAWTYKQYLSTFIIITTILAAVWVSIIETKANNVYAEEYNLYQLDLAKWNEAYYCSQDDIVFLPQTGKYDKPENILNL
jgi:hypothetical protein